MKTKQAKEYRAYKHVRQYVADEHAYNMFLSTVHTFYELRLFFTTIKEIRQWQWWQRVAHKVKNAKI